jgi:hypothetical protein
MKTTKPEESQQLAMLEPPESQLPARQVASLTGINIAALIDKAVDAKAAIEVLKELRAMERDIAAERSKAAFDESMSGFQVECEPILKEKGVPTSSGAMAYKYAPIEAIEIQIRPLCRKHGFSHTFDTDTTSAEGWVIAKCLVTHKDGHSRVSTAKFPLGTKTNIMSNTQQYAAALTFANRRALCNAYGLILVGEDLDGDSGRLKGSKTTVRPQAQPTHDDATNKRKLVDMLRNVIGVASGYNLDLRAKELLDGYLHDENIIGDQQGLSDLAGAELANAVAKVQAKLSL